MRPLFLTLSMFMLGCGGISSSPAGQPADAGGGSTDVAVPTDAVDAIDETAPACLDPLRTGQRDQDLFDCDILGATADAVEPDPMIFKAEIALESNFAVFATSPDSPCGVKIDWSSSESKSFGLMQLTP